MSYRQELGGEENLKKAANSPAKALSGRNEKVLGGGAGWCQLKHNELSGSAAEHGR